MRRTFALLAVMAMVFVGAAPAGAATDVLDGPSPAIWLSDPEGDVGATPDIGIEQGDLVEGSSGTARVNKNGATITVKATGLEPGHAYTMWVVYFSDQTLCADRGSGVAGCNGEDLPFAGAGIFYGDGKVADGSGELTFSARLNDGDEAGPPPPPPPVSFAPYQAGPDNEFHVVIRSHGPTLPGQVSDQIQTLEGGCDTEVGPDPEQLGDFPVPAAPGECGDVQLYVFS